MKTKNIMLLIAVVSFPAMLLAQVTNAVTPNTPLPTTTTDFWVYGIAIIVPVLVNIFKKLVPNIPTWMLPVSTPFIGMALGAGLKALGWSQMGWVDMAQAGAMAVMIRESFNQIVVKQMEGGKTPGGVLKSIIIGFATMLALPSMAAQPSVHGTNKALQAYVDGSDKKTAKTEEHFGAGEFDLSLYGAGVIANESRSKDDVRYSGGIGATYWVTKGFGIGGLAELSDFKHSVIDLGMGRLSVRAPLWDTVAPYGFVDGGFHFEHNRWHVDAGGGLELRIAQGWGVFGEAGLGTTTRGEGYGLARAGIRLSF